GPERADHREGHAVTRLLAILALGAAGCVEFNSECTPPIDAPDDIVAWLAEDVPVARPVVRTQETALGDALTDAYLRVLAEKTGDEKPTVALENAGSIRDQGLCTTRTVLFKGPLPRRALRDTVPFTNEIVTVKISEKQLINILEHAVASLHIPG